MQREISGLSPIKIPRRNQAPRVRSRAMAARARAAPPTEDDAAADDLSKQEAQRQAAGARIASVAPLFADLATAGADLDSISVHRLEPIEEGFLGKVELNANEETIKGRWGGGKFRLQLKTTKGLIKGSKNMEISGEPVLQSDGARAKYRRLNGLPLEDPVAAPVVVAPAPAAPALGTSDLLTLFTTFQSMQAEADRRRSEDQQRREDQRRKDEEAREDRLRKEAAEQRLRDQEHQTQMLLMIKEFARPAAAAAAEPQANLLEAFTNGMKTAQTLALQAAPAARDDDDEGDGGRGAGGGSDAASMVQAAVRGIVDAAAARFGPGSQATAPVGAAATTEAGDGGVNVSGPLADQMRGFVIDAQAKGQDPNRLLTRAVAVLRHNLQGAPPPAAPAQPVAPVTPVAPPVPEVPTGSLIAQAAAEVARQRRSSNGVSPAA